MIKNLTPEQRDEYRNFVKESVANKSYFKDSVDWYMTRYVNPICERSILVLILLTTTLITYAVSLAIRDSLPITEPLPIALEAGDMIEKFPTIRKLKDPDIQESIDESVAKHLLITYLKEREGYNFEGSSLNDLREINAKLEKIQNNSSEQEFKNFKNSKNPYSPLSNSKKNISRTVEIISVSFSRIENNNLIDKAKSFIYTRIPSEVEILYTASIIKNKKPHPKKYLTKISFEFSGVRKKEGDDNEKKERINFQVIDYKTYTVK